jgi:hypothetical protein
MGQLTEEQAQRAMQIVSEFVSWTPEVGPCPISISNHHWFKKLCALAETMAMLESQLAEARAALIREEPGTASDTSTLWISGMGYSATARNWPVFLENAPKQFATFNLSDPCFSEAVAPSDWRHFVGEEVRHWWPGLSRQQRVEAIRGAMRRLDEAIDRGEFND